MERRVILNNYIFSIQGCMNRNRESKKNKGNIKSEKLSIRDYITLAMMLILIFAIYAIIGMPMAMTIIGNVFMHSVCALLWGTVFILMYTKVNKKWVALKFGCILGVMQLMNFWPTALFLMLGGFLSEVIWQHMDKKSFRTMLICFTTQISFWYLGIYLPLLMIGDIGNYMSGGYVDMYIAIREIIAGPLFFIGLFTTIVGSIIGSFIGRRLLNKHFKKAGII